MICLIDFDRTNIKMLKYIRRHCKDKGVTWATLEQVFGDDRANSYFLIALDKEGYIVTKDENGEWITYSDHPRHVDDRYTVFASPKAMAFLEQRNFDILKWTIPTLISVVALVISIFSLLKQ